MRYSFVLKNTIALCLTSLCLTVLAEEPLGSPDYLEDDWEQFYQVATGSGQSDKSEIANSTWSDYFWNHAKFKVKSDLAYDDSLTLARTHARFESAFRPFNQAFVKLDAQYHYYHQKDDLVLSSDAVKHALKISDLWLQYTYQSCNAKLGQQKLFWGAVEGSYALDVLMPLDTTEPLLTDFSQIRRAQAMAVFSCFMGDIDFELFFTPEPLLNQSTLRQTQSVQQLEDKLHEEWGGRITKQYPGLDISLYLARVFENNPQPVIDFNTFSLAGYQVDQMDLYGLSLVQAIGKLLLELDFSYQEQRKRMANGLMSPSETLSYRKELALGFEYTTYSNHQLSGGVWFFSYVSPMAPETKRDAEVWNVSWTKQYLNDDLTLSTLALWQKQPDSGQLTFMGDFLWNDHWSSSLALSYRVLSSSASETPLDIAIKQGWSVQLSGAYQF